MLNLFQSSDQDLMLMQKSWASQINPVLSNVFLQGSFLTNINLVANTPLVINHYLGKQMNGWLVVDNTAFCEVKRIAPLNNSTLTLEANATTSISLWCF